MPEDKQQPGEKQYLEATQDVTIENLNYLRRNMMGLQDPLYTGGYCNGDAVLPPLQHLLTKHKMRHAEFHPEKFDTEVNRVKEVMHRDATLISIYKNHQSFMAYLQSTKQRYSEYLKKVDNKESIPNLTSQSLAEGADDPEQSKHLSDFANLIDTDTAQNDYIQYLANEHEKWLTYLRYYENTALLYDANQLFSDKMQNDWAFALDILLNPNDETQSKDVQLEKTFELSYVFYREEMASLLKGVMHNDNFIMLGTHRHTTSAWFDGEKYHYYDPNLGELIFENENFNDMVNVVFENINSKSYSYDEKINLSISVLEDTKYNKDNNIIHKYPDKAELLKSYSETRKQEGKNFSSVQVETNKRDQSMTVSSLWMAAMTGDIEVAKHCMENKAEVDEIGYHGSSPLHEAAKNGHAKLVEFLIRNGASVSLKDDEEQTPLFIAALYGKTDIVDILIKNGAKPRAESAKKGETVLHAACTNGQEALISRLLEKDANVVCDMKNRKGETPLHYAALSGNLKIMKMLMEKANNRIFLTNDDETPLDYAIANKHYHLVEYILQKTKLNQTEYKKLGKSRLIEAVKNADYETAKLLIEHGEDIDAKESYTKNTALDYGIIQNTTSIVELLLDAGLKANFSHLKKAAEKGQLGTLKALLKSHPSSSEETQMLLEVSAKHGQKNVVQYFVESNKALDTKGAIIEAAREGQLQIVKFFLQKGVKLKELGQPLLDAAEQGNNLQLIDFIYNIKKIESQSQHLNENIDISIKVMSKEISRLNKKYPDNSKQDDVWRNAKARIDLLSDAKTKLTKLNELVNQKDLSFKNDALQNGLSYSSSLLEKELDYQNIMHILHEKTAKLPHPDELKESSVRKALGKVIHLKAKSKTTKEIEKIDFGCAGKSSLLSYTESIRKSANDTIKQIQKVDQASTLTFSKDTQLLESYRYKKQQLVYSLIKEVDEFQLKVQNDMITESCFELFLNKLDNLKKENVDINKEFNSPQTGPFVSLIEKATKGIQTQEKTYVKLTEDQRNKARKA